MINRLIAGTLPLLPKRLVWLFSRSYIAGETVDEAMAACRSLNAEGLKTTIDILGEFIQNRDEAQNNRDEYLSLIDIAQQNGIDGNYSVKPTMFGLLIDAEICYGHIHEIVAKAADFGKFIRIAFQRHHEINTHFLQDLEFMFQNGVYPGIATHDRALVDGSLALIERYGVPRNGYEFQMLYGVTPELRRSLVAAGHTMRVYVPYGRSWFGYSTRRLKENPKIVNNIVRSLLWGG